MAPDADSVPGRVLEHGIELATAGALGAVGAVIGFGIGIWLVHEDGLRNNF